MSESTMKPRVFLQVWRDVATDEPVRRWHVEFEDSCGCVEEEDFPDHDRAQRFANRIAAGVSRWHA